MDDETEDVFILELTEYLKKKLCYAQAVQYTPMQDIS
jgi:hypothetical protein